MANRFITYSFFFFPQAPIVDFSRCPHHDSLPSIYGDYFLPVSGSFVIDARDDNVGDLGEAFFRDYDGRKVISFYFLACLPACLLACLFSFIPSFLFFPLFSSSFFFSFALFSFFLSIFPFSSFLSFSSHFSFSSFFFILLFLFFPLFFSSFFSFSSLFSCHPSFPFLPFFLFSPCLLFFFFVSFSFLSIFYFPYFPLIPFLILIFLCSFFIPLLFFLRSLFFMSSLLLIATSRPSSCPLGPHLPYRSGEPPYFRQFPNGKNSPRLSQRRNGRLADRRHSRFHPPPIVSTRSILRSTLPMSRHDRRRKRPSSRRRRHILFHLSPKTTTTTATPLFPFRRRFHPYLYSFDGRRRKSRLAPADSFTQSLRLPLHGPEL